MRALLLIALLLTSCGKKEDDPKLKFAFEIENVAVLDGFASSEAEVAKTKSRVEALVRVSE